MDETSGSIQSRRTANPEELPQKSHRQPGSPHSKKSIPLLRVHQPDSAHPDIESTASVSFRETKRHPGRRQPSSPKTAPATISKKQPGSPHSKKSNPSSAKDQWVFVSDSVRKYSLSHFGKSKSNQGPPARSRQGPSPPPRKTAPGQVHPTARSRYPCAAFIHQILPIPVSKVPLRSRFGKQNHIRTPPGIVSNPTRLRATPQNLLSKNSRAVLSTFFRPVRSGKIRAIEIAPIIVTIIARKFLSLSALRRPGI